MKPILPHAWCLTWLSAAMAGPALAADGAFHGVVVAEQGLGPGRLGEGGLQGADAFVAGGDAADDGDVDHSKLATVY